MTQTTHSHGPCSLLRQFHNAGQPNHMKTIILTLLAFTIGSALAHADVYDITSDWSDSTNPNGVWSYNQGTSPLPHVANWTGGVISFPQPAWAPSNNPGNFLPVWMKMAADFNSEMLLGDVIVHSIDFANGIGNSPANVAWTSLIDGIASISGAVWQARDIGRSNHWSLSIDGVVVTGGDISAANSSRAVPFDFTAGSGGASALTNISVFAGQVIKLQLDETSTNNFGDFVGVKFSVNVVPEPSTVLLGAFGILGLMLRRNRNERMA